LNRAGLIFPSAASIALPPLAVGVLTIPVRVDPKAKGRYSLVAAPAAAGTGGTRIRQRRMQGVSSRIPGWLTLLGSFAGILVWGGGMKIAVDVRRAEGSQAPNNTTPEPRTELIWRPTEAQILGVAG
jgi:hypothetical protein